jgi:predicted GNAT family N-acyltransferase
MEVRPARDADEVSQALELRRRVFCGEQGVAAEVERDPRDDDATHVVAVADGRVLGTCRLVFTGGAALLGRLVVERAERRRGVGSALVRAAADLARVAGARRMSLHAQLAARGLYASAGFAERGEPFVQQGIDHVAMERALA